MKPVATNPGDFLRGGFTMTKMIIVDRDGVINQDLDDRIKWPEESMPVAWKPLVNLKKWVII